VNGFAPGESIPWHYRLATQFGAVTLGFIVAAGIAIGAVDAATEQTILDEARAGAALFGGTIGAAIGQSMLEDRRPVAYGIMMAIGAQPSIERIRMVNKEGRITFSTAKGEAGQAVERDDPACLACHAAPRPISQLDERERSRLVDGDGHRALGLVMPVYNDTRCANAACHHHSRGEQVLGIIDVEVSLAAADERLAVFRRSGVAVGFAVMVVAGVFVHLIVSRRVVRPVAELVEVTHRVARHEPNARAPVEDPGELGHLARSFNDMIGEVRRAEDGLVELNQQLEQKVEERTAELRHAQAALVQTEKLSSLGQLSASIAHEINNPLAGILTYAKLLAREAERDVQDGERRKAFVQRLALVQRETERCSAIVRNLLDFARERPLRLDEVDVAAVVRESLQLVGHQLSLLGHRVEVDVQPAPPVRADFGELRQAVVNLAMNAAEAMGRDGRMAVAVRPTEGEGAVELVVTDDGPGVPEGIRTRIFDPFFTTKEKGTGLGLSVVYGIVQRHGGSIRVEGAPVKGARFIVTLPAARPATASPAPSDGASA
jgi:two-component system NtrC family sensor kinase